MQIWDGFNHKLVMELDLQSLFGLQMHSCTVYTLAETPQAATTLPPPFPAFGLIYEGAIGQPR